MAMPIGDITCRAPGLSAMAMPIGDITCRAPGLFHWNIHLNASCLSQPILVKKSSNFTYAGSSYSILFKRRFKETEICLSRENDSPSHKVHVKLGIWIVNKLQFETDGEIDKNSYLNMIVPMSFRRMIEYNHKIAPYGRLTVSCEFKTSDTEENATVLDEEHPNEIGFPQGEEADSDEDTEYKIFKQLQKDFGRLLLNREDSDVNIIVQGTEFPAHRSILRVRSPVFRSMFSHEMLEKLSGEVVVDDCDPGTFPDFLNYLYTGIIKHISVENVCQLYVTSDKYQVEELKDVCKAYMKRNFSVGAFCDILTLALRHTETELIDLSTEFFCANAKEITTTSKWQTFLKENATVGNELFIKYLSKEKNI